MKDQIEHILGGVLDVDGVDGVMAIDREGMILGSLMPGVYDVDLLDEASAAIVNVVSTIRELGIRPDDLAFDYPSTTLVVRDLRHGHLLLLTQATISISLLNIATNVARKKLTKLLAPASSTSQRKRRKATSARNIVPTEVVVAQPSPASPQVTHAAGSSLGQTSMSEAFHSLAPCCIVFNQLLRAIVRNVAEANPAVVPKIMSALEESSGRQKLGAPVLAAIGEFAVSGGTGRILAPIEEKQLSELMHAVYVCLCEALGPILGDQVVSSALQATRNIPEAKDFSPYDLL